MYIYIYIYIYIEREREILAIIARIANRFVRATCIASALFLPDRSESESFAFGFGRGVLLGDRASSGTTSRASDRGRIRVDFRTGDSINNRFLSRSRIVKDFDLHENPYLMNQLVGNIYIYIYIYTYIHTYMYVYIYQTLCPCLCRCQQSAIPGHT